MTARVGRFPIWLLIVSTALIASVLTLALDRTITRFAAAPTPTATSLSAVQPIIVTIPTIEPTPPTEPLSDAAQAQLLQQLSVEADQDTGFTFVIKAQLRISYALEALQRNDVPRAESDLVAARADLDEALTRVPEALRSQIDTERLELSRIRADLHVDPRDLDEDLRLMRDRLLSLISS